MRNDTCRIPFDEHAVVATSNIEEARAALETVFLPVQLTPRKKSTGPRLNMTFNALRIGETTVSCVRFDLGVQVSTENLEHFHLNLPLRGTAQCRSGRSPHVAATPETGAIFMPDQSAEIDWGDGCVQFCLMFPRQRLHRELQTMLDRPVSTPIEFAPHVNLTTELGRTWITMLHLIDHQSRGPHGFLQHPLAATNLETMLIDSLLVGQAHNYSQALNQPHPATPPNAIRQAIELIRTQPERAWTTATLAHEVSVSPRSLQEGFQRCAGMPPMRYLRDVRLDRVHDDLAAATADSATVANLARRWGFLYLGRFAAIYREKFGQTPSQTLREAHMRTGHRTLR